MNDQQFLWWLHERLVKTHGEREMVDYMHRLRAIIVDMPAKDAPPQVARMDTEAAILRERFSA